MVNLVSIKITADIGDLVAKLAEAEILVKASADRMSKMLGGVNFGGMSISSLLARGLLGGAGGAGIGGVGAAAGAGGPAAAGGGGILSTLGVPGSIAVGAAGAGPAIAIAATIGQMIGGALITGLGAALTGIAVFGAMKSKGVTDVFSNLSKVISRDLGDIGKPFVSVLESIGRTAGTIGAFMTPIFKGAAQILAGPVGAFANSFLNAFRNPAVAQAIQAVASAFGKMLAAVSPQLSADIGQIANAIKGLADAIGKNPQIFATFARMITDVISWAFNLLSALTQVANWIDKHWTGMWTGAASEFLQFGKILIGAAQMITDAVLAFFGGILKGASTAFGWIPGLGGKLRDAVTSFYNFKSSVDTAFHGAMNTVSQWQKTLYNTPKMVALRADISDLQSKLLVAEQDLKNPALSATQKAKITADISQLEAQLARAKQELAAMNGVTATTYVQTILQNTGSPGFRTISGVAATSSGSGTQGKRKGTGGIIGAATGGIRSGLTMVGEYGAELVALPTGSHVYSSADTQSMLGGGVGGLVQIIISGGESAFDQFMITWIKKHARILGGGNVQVAFGRH